VNQIFFVSFEIFKPLLGQELGKFLMGRFQNPIARIAKISLGEVVSG